MVKKKGGRDMNPADAFRKTQRAKEIQRNKKERKFQREAYSLKSNPDAIKEELKAVLDAEEDGKVSQTLRLKKRALQGAYDTAVKKKKEEEVKAKLGNDYAFHSEHGHGAPDRPPQESVYFHPTLNPLAIPPAGKPQRYRGSADVLALPAAGLHDPAAHNPAASLPVPKPPPLPAGPAPGQLLPPPPGAPPVPPGLPPQPGSAPLPPPPGPPPGSSGTVLPPPEGPPPTAAEEASNRLAGTSEEEAGPSPGSQAALPPPAGPPPGMMFPPRLPPPMGPPPGMMRPPGMHPGMHPLPPPAMPPPGFPRPLAPPPGPPPGMGPQKDGRTIISGATTVVRMPKAQNDKSVTSMVPASLRIRREAAPTTTMRPRVLSGLAAAKTPVVGPGFGLAPKLAPKAAAPSMAPAPGPKPAVPAVAAAADGGGTAMDRKYQDFLSEMAGLGALEGEAA
ncbi:hypothetical protein WJX72_010156 [[Myrmecia] bisecta]|uniref:Wbp11/ELF5/Saf1 N-terminal domain-containing protein n=1 Tax=[Myrmecia] bisecta TaxID=41462 RepID=A0AAW1PI25_9CHLO